MCEGHYVDLTMLMTWSKNHVGHKCTLNVDIGFFLLFLFWVNMQPPDRSTGMSFGHCQCTMGLRKNNFDLDRGPILQWWHICPVYGRAEAMCIFFPRKTSYYRFRIL